ncbi:uncharacterized protein NFIA_098370 [Aspergillus fischeri NRRL 181]|uniref:Uncharacterized protein n=1 Tax=Neosartorya fischeri (strain ATCC 1020 / DSM 3700 / CBS 544.65 / FGSC A1164 / JCM 1740 / NRRL 181 / WB 181) TaxID=331117 RepID=A1DBG7_NEOFI|nr:uncharacterized protein NFIA_098370 [Aspergillus fischeri NRRL 181]EAW20207.1 hypothetical protein NFIA_098370 [Aspergillus fischeri NRRL 181]
MEAEEDEEAAGKQVANSVPVHQLHLSSGDAATHEAGRGDQDLTYRARGTDERDTAVVGVYGRVAAGEADLFGSIGHMWERWTYAGAGLLSGRQRHGGGEEEGKREETHFGR